jgi:hypothetical protein
MMQVYRRLSELKKYRFEARDGRIGSPEEVYFDDGQWKVRYFVVHTGVWFFGSDVLILPGMITGVDDENNTLRVDLTRERIKNSPPAETARPVSRHYEEQYYAYYGLQPYWSGIPLAGSAAKPLEPSFKEEFIREPPDMNLRSSKAVTGYTIRAVDGSIGHVRDFILGDEHWDIRYLEVDTGSWLPGRKVVIAPSWITEVDWVLKEVSVKLDRKAIETAPEYDPDRLISRHYELEVFRHYSTSIQEEKKDD